MKHYSLALALCLSCFARGEPLRVLLEQGHYKRARIAATQFYEKSPADPEVLSALAIVNALWGNADKALESAEKAVALAPKTPRYHVVLAEILAARMQRSGIIDQVLTGWRVQQQLETALKLDPRSSEAMYTLMQFYYQAPVLAGGSKAKSRELIARIGSIDPAVGCIAQVWLGLNEKQPVQIGQLYLRALNASPANVDARAGLVNFYIAPAIRNYVKAETQARELRRVAPNRIEGHALLAVTLVQQAKWKDLDLALAESEKDIPDNLWSYLRAADACLSKSVELTRAEAYYRKYLSQDPEPNMPSPATAHWHLGLVLEKEGRMAEAKAELGAAVKLDPNSGARDDLERLK